MGFYSSHNIIIAIAGDYTPTPVLAKFSLFPSVSPMAIIQPWNPEHPYGSISLSGTSGMPLDH